MIYDNIKNCKNYLINEKFKVAFDFLNVSDGMATGRYDLDCGVYANVMEVNTKQQSEGTIEAHYKYIDVQYVAKGFETMGFALDYSEVTKEVEQGGDIYFVKADCQFVSLKKGDFAIFFPNDYHMPCIGDGDKIKKIVVKIPI